MNETPFERIIAKTDDEKNEAHSELQKFYDVSDNKLEEFEVEKTPEEIEVINLAQETADNIVRRYDGKVRSVPIERIHILPVGGVSKALGGNIEGGVLRTLHDRIGVDRRTSKIQLASVIVHELLHLKSPKAAQTGEKHDDVRPYRSGLTMFDRKYVEGSDMDEVEYFGELEEAVVAECAKLATEELRMKLLNQEEIAAHEKFLGWIVAFMRRHRKTEDEINLFIDELKDAGITREDVEKIDALPKDEEYKQAYAAGTFSRRHKDGDAEGAERYHERKKMYDMLDKLVADSNGKIKDRDEAFTLFARANFTGNYLPLARVVEETLGKGSFRKMASEFAEIHKPKN